MSFSAIWKFITQGDSILEAIDILTKEVNETKAMVSQLVGAVSDTATRVSEAITLLKKGTINPTILSAMAADLDAEQVKLGAILVALSGIAPAPVVEPPAPVVPVPPPAPPPVVVEPPAVEPTPAEPPAESIAVIAE